MQDLTGKKIGRYKILKSIGEGGMATVYLSEDTNLERQVALKVIRAERVTPEQLPRIMERFKREARALAMLSDDPGIVTVYDYGEFEGTPYLVMAYMPGGTLKDRLGQPMAYREAARLLLPVAEALSLAHEHGIVHRDVKPSNLLVDRKGNLALADFGIAKAMEMDGQTLTGTGMGIGTPEYMAPEQWKGDASPQTDIYALGVVLYEMVTGKKPYSAGTPSEVFLKQMTQPPERPRDLVPGLPASMEYLLDKAMDKDPESRFASMVDFQAALAGVLRGEPAHDETPVVLAQPKQRDPEATHDELATPPEGFVLGQGKHKMQPAKTKMDGTVGLLKSRKLWALGMGAMAVLGLVWGIAVGVNGEGLLHGLAIATIIPTQTPAPIPMPTLGVESTMISEKDGMALVYVPAGIFIMGSDKYSDEQPVHEVYLDGYWIDKYEVTNAQYKECVIDGACEEPGNVQFFEKAAYVDHPVVYVDWNDAKDYCAWAGRRLLSEAEWEKAARGADRWTYPWGEERPSNNLLNYDYNGGDTMPVGRYADGASPYGALDMAGNVWEWTGSLYDDYPWDSEDGRQDLNASGSRVLRGGSWGSSGGYVRSADRDWYAPSYSDEYLGFRCASSETEINEQETTLIEDSVSELSIGSTNVSDKDGMEQVYVPAGEFSMGSNDGDSDELPVHEVVLDGYWIDKYEVTKAQYAVFLNEMGNRSEGGLTWLDAEDDAQIFKMDGIWQAEAVSRKQPVVEVTWYGAAAYCEWAGRRLPSEAEWEKAARGRDGRTYPWGENISCEYAQYTDCDDKPFAVGSLQMGVSPYGALDMAGNVWEWTGSQYEDYPFEPDDGREELNSFSSRVLRGGSWASSGMNVRSANRLVYFPNFTNGDLGFRCASSP